MLRRRVKVVGGGRLWFRSSRRSLPPPRWEMGYFPATHHPWPCLLFLLPLLLAYEGGVLWLGGTQPEALRNGADTWLRWGLDAFGFHHLYWAPGLIVVFLLGWSWVRRYDRPEDLFGTCTGMAIESVVFAIGLWGMGRGFGPLLDTLGISLDCPPQADGPGAQVVTFVGAGIYEEVLFRLLLFSGLVWLLRRIEVSSLVAVLVSGVASALLFSAAHHIGPYGETFDTYAFVFRTLAGLYFALVFQLRGFGVAVGAHACYDVLVGARVG